MHLQTGGSSHRLSGERKKEFLVATCVCVCAKGSRAHCKHFKSISEVATTHPSGGVHRHREREKASGTVPHILLVSERRVHERYYYGT